MKNLLFMDFFLGKFIKRVSILVFQNLRVNKIFNAKYNFVKWWKSLFLFLFYYEDEVRKDYRKWLFTSTLNEYVREIAVEKCEITDFVFRN